MNGLKPFPVILHVRVPSILRGCDQQRYLERKLRDFGLRLRPPMKLAGTDIPVGYGLLRFGMGEWNVVEARGEVDARVTILALQQHELVEDAMDEALEMERRARREAERAAAWAAMPHEEYDDEEEIRCIGPRIGPVANAAMGVAAFILAPIGWIDRGVRGIRCWYVREHG